VSTPTSSDTPTPPTTSSPTTTSATNQVYILSVVKDHEINLNISSLRRYPNVVVVVSVGTEDNLMENI
jgi:hypothetical protein